MPQSQDDWFLRADLKTAEGRFQAELNHVWKQKRIKLHLSFSSVVTSVKW